jgi:hypothetical protein
MATPSGTPSGTPAPTTQSRGTTETIPEDEARQIHASQRPSTIPETPAASIGSLTRASSSLPDRVPPAVAQAGPSAARLPNTTSKRRALPKESADDSDSASDSITVLEGPPVKKGKGKAVRKDVEEVELLEDDDDEDDESDGIEYPDWLEARPDNDATRRAKSVYRDSGHIVYSGPEACENCVEEGNEECAFLRGKACAYCRAFKLSCSLLVKKEKIATPSVKSEKKPVSMSSSFAEPTPRLVFLILSWLLANYHSPNKRHAPSASTSLAPPPRKKTSTVSTASEGETDVWSVSSGPAQAFGTAALRREVSQLKEIVAELQKDHKRLFDRVNKLILESFDSKN